MRRNLREQLESIYGAETVTAEQQLSATQPLHLDNYVQRALRRFSRKFHAEGNLGKEHRASEGAIFPIPSFLLPVSGNPKFLQLAAEPDPLGFEIIDGETYYRIFLHPADAALFASLAKKGRPDPKTWYGSPTSSHRSLFLLNPDEPALPPTILKVSLRTTVYGFPRLIGPKETARAVLMTDLVAQAHQRTGGALPGGARWTFFPESFALLPEGFDEGGYIIRRYPRGFYPREDIFLPYYALLSERTEGRWIDRLFEASGERDSEGFLWNRIALPIVELYQQLCLDFGLSPELHRQNVGLIVEKSTLRIKSLYLRDMDGVELDLPYRSHLGLKEGLPLPPWVDGWNNVIRPAAAQINQAFNFYFLGAMNLDQTAKGFLPRRRVAPFLRRVNQVHLDELNRRFGTQIRSLAGISRFWDGLHRRIAPPATLALVSDSRRRSTAWYGRLRQFELWIGSKFYWGRAKT